jgi:hypothetical protein
MRFPTTMAAAAAALTLASANVAAQEAAAPWNPDIARAVACATLSQQFGDVLTALTAPTAATKLDDAVKATATDQATAGRKACMAKAYEPGLDQLRQAIGTLGKRPIV